jgi:hypothetical protein
VNRNGRNRVLWVGREPPAELQGVAEVLGLVVEPTQNVDAIDVSQGDLNAVLVFAVANDDKKALGRLLHLCARRAAEFGVLLGAASTDATHAYTLQGVLKSKNFNIVALGTKTQDFARILRDHRAGAPANPRLAIPLPGHESYGTLRDETENHALDSILLQRAFNGFSRITLTSQEGGFSRESKVWRIDAYNESGRCHPFVAKAGRQEDLQSEFETYRNFVRDFIPFPFRAPVLEDRFVKGASRAVLVSAFVGRSQRLDKYLAAATNPELITVSLFDGALGTWRRNAEKMRRSLGQYYVREQSALDPAASREEKAKNALLPDQTSLDATYEKARKTTKHLLSPSEIWRKLESIPERDHFFCLIHGDLNIRNVFVRWNTIDAILIDFSHSGKKESLARDPAKLETSIALTAKNAKNQRLPIGLLRRLYSGRLIPPRDFVEFDGRTEAIRQIRRHVGGEGVSTEEYELLTLCHLLRFACPPADQQRNEPGMEQRRAVSYVLACGLLENL